jgi:hypothetical protein
VITVDQVLAELGQPPSTPAAADRLTQVVAATNDYVLRVRPDLVGVWSASVDRGALNLAAKWYHLTGNQPGGDAVSYGDVSSIPLDTGEIDRLLEVGRHHLPVVA